MPTRFIFATLTALNRPFSHDAGRDGVRRVKACATRAFNRGVRRVNSISQKLLICVARTHRRAFPPRETEQAGGSRINFAAPASKKTRPRVGLFGGHPPRTPSWLSLRLKAGSEARLAALKAFSHFFADRNGQKKKWAKNGVSKGLVARSARRCAAVDVGGFGVASSRDITPMRQAIRASSPHELAHAVLCQEIYFPAHGCEAATSLSPQDRLMTSTHASGRRYAPMQ
ncbi:hypothetical protein PEC730217_16420 [Pectobacterium carotovorum subsp. carotovorum]|nr:hypothetical protein EG330_00875 [Pectobacterium versatile]GKW32862.1 hypothetical protein PEC730217_16420 [Pectobacterium carotovorum subsp. carotovorum]